MKYVKQKKAKMRIKFDITLQANFWNKSPEILVLLNDNLVAEENNFSNDQNKKISFESDVEEGPQNLTIRRLNKPVKDTELQDNKIVKDSVVTISDIIIDRISMEPWIDKGFFFPKYPEPWLSQQKHIGKEPPEKYDYCRTLHHNGDWKLDFGYPVHIWFFQNIHVEI